MHYVSLRKKKYLGDLQTYKTTPSKVSMGRNQEVTEEKVIAPVQNM